MNQDRDSSEDESLYFIPPANLILPPLPPVQVNKLYRHILADKPRVTRFQISWDEKPINKGYEMTEQDKLNSLEENKAYQAAQLELQQFTQGTNHSMAQRNNNINNNNNNNNSHDMAADMSQSSDNEEAEDEDDEEDEELMESDGEQHHQRNRMEDV